MGTTTTLHVHHVFLYISLPSLHDYNLQFFFFFMEDVNKRRQILPLFEFLGIQLPESWPTFDEVSELNNRGED